MNKNVCEAKKVITKEKRDRTTAPRSLPEEKGMRKGGRISCKEEREGGDVKKRGVIDGKVLQSKNSLKTRRFSRFFWTRKLALYLRMNSAVRSPTPNSLK